MGAKELVLVVRKNAVSMKVQTFANTPAERLRLSKRLSTFLSALEMYSARAVDSYTCLPATRPALFVCD